MDIFNWKSLQNGSDIRGIASEGIEGEFVTLTPERVHKIAGCFAIWLAEKLDKSIDSLKIGVGRDSRISGPELMHYFVEGLLERGIHTFDCSLASTPAMYMSTILDNMCFDGAVILTASHLPYNRNGIKFFTNEGGLNSPDILKILELAESEILGSGNKRGEIIKIDLISEYASFLRRQIIHVVNHPVYFEKPLYGFHIIVDAGNGAGGFFADKVLLPLGADISGSQFLEPDGMFPNHIPNPEDTEAMLSIQKAVITNKADIGIIFDTDVDRSAVVDRNGNSINRNKLIALIGAIILEEHPGTYIVTDSITSDGLNQFLEKELGGIHYRYKRGYKNVINEAIRLNNIGHECWLAIETSGHAALKENHFLDDGAYLVTKVLVKAAKMRLLGNQDELKFISGLHEPIESTEIRIKILDTNFKTTGNQILMDLEQFVRSVNGWKLVPDNHEGIRVQCEEKYGNGWFLMRLSLHDPVIPLNIESDQKDGIKYIFKRLQKFLAKYDSIQFSVKNDYL